MARWSPMVDCVAVDRFFPQADPAPWAGKTRTPSGRASSRSWSERYRSRARSAALEPADDSRSGRPTSPMKRVSPVRTPHGSSLSPSETTTQIDSGVWPGVARISSVTRPRGNRCPSASGSMANSVLAASP